MRNRNRALAVVACVAVLVLAAPAPCQDWPQWRGPNRDGTAPAFAAPKAWPKALATKWKTKVGAGDATPALVGGKLYVFARQGAKETLICLDAADGHELWKTGYPAREVSGPARRHPGPRSSPAVGEGKVVTLGVGGVVCCFDAATGKIAWQKDPFPGQVPMFFTSASPLIADGLAVVPVGGRGKGAVIAWSLADGSEKWRWAGGAPEYASPVLLKVGQCRQVVSFTEKELVGLNLADGKLLWKLPFASQRRAYNASTPVVVGRTVIYCGAQRGTHAVKIEQRGEKFVPVELWSNENAPQFASPVVVDGLLFCLSEGGTLYCIDAATGRTAWTDATRNGRSFGALVAGGGAVLALPNTSELVAFRPDGKQYRELARIKVAETPTYAGPVVSSGRIFVRDQDTVALLTVP